MIKTKPTIGARTKNSLGRGAKVRVGILARWDRGYVVRRILQSAFIVWAVFTLSFLILFILPGDPAMLMLGGADAMGTVSPAELVRVNELYGFDRPLLVQYLLYLGNALTGDFGTSFQSGAPVSRLVLDGLANTIGLVAFAFVVAVILGLTIGCLAVSVRSRALGRALDTLPSIGASLPTFWVGLILMQVLSFQLGLLPTVGDHGVISLVMPGITLAIPAAAFIAQVVSASLRRTMDEPFIEVVRSKGAGEARIFFLHALRNALLPPLTVLGMLVATMFVAATIVETIFSRPGLGYLLESAISFKDIPVVQAITVIIAVIYVLMNLIVDLIYPLLDPRIVRQPARRGRSGVVVG